jgi:hypothetical protein
LFMVPRRLLKSFDCILIIIFNASWNKLHLGFMDFAATFCRDNSIYCR